MKKKKIHLTMQPQKVKRKMKQNSNKKMKQQKLQVNTKFSKMNNKKKRILFKIIYVKKI